MTPEDYSRYYLNKFDDIIYRDDETDGFIWPSNKITKILLKQKIATAEKIKNSTPTGSDTEVVINNEIKFLKGALEVLPTQV